MQVDRIALLFLACAACSSGAPPDRGAVPDATGADARDVVASDTSPSGAADAADDKAPDTPAPDAQDAADHAASDARGPDAPDAPHGTRYLALGDSYTIGQSVDEADRFPVQLVARLRADGVDIAGPEIIARTGWTTDELDGGIDAAGPRGPYALVTLLIGVNNQYRGRPVETYTPEFTALLQRSIGIAGDDPGRVVVVSIPDYGATPFGQRGDPARTGREIDAYNAAAQEQTVRAGAHWVDITAESREALVRPSLVASDGLHPSGEMYAEWVALMLPSARAALER